MGPGTAIYATNGSLLTPPSSFPFLSSDRRQAFSPTQPLVPLLAKQLKTIYKGRSGTITCLFNHSIAQWLPTLDLMPKNKGISKAIDVPYATDLCPLSKRKSILASPLSYNRSSFARSEAGIAAIRARKHWDAARGT
ncbi:hypothetical protein WN943_006670 [Citrus x changshan-huyou]